MLVEQLESGVPDRVVNQLARARLQGSFEVEVGRHAAETAKLLADLYIVLNALLIDCEVILRWRYLSGNLVDDRGVL